MFVGEDHRCTRSRGSSFITPPAFAAFGFIVGLTFTVQGGEPADLVYHVTMLPVLIATAVLLANELRSLRNVV